MSKIVLTATGGGHLEQIKQLNSLKNEHEILYLVADTPINREMTGVCFLPEIHNEKRISKYFDLLKNAQSSYSFLRKHRPDVVISTGAISTFPVCWIQKKIFHGKVIFIESFAKRTSGTKTGRLVYKFADHFIVQWEEMKKVYPRAIYGGMIY